MPKGTLKKRTALAATRRFNGLVRHLLGDRDDVGAAEMAVARQAAAVMLRCEQLQAELVRGDAVDPLALARPGRPGRAREAGRAPSRP